MDMWVTADCRCPQERGSTLWFITGAEVEEWGGRGRIWQPSTSTSNSNANENETNAMRLQKNYKGGLNHLCHPKCTKWWNGENWTERVKIRTKSETKRTIMECRDNRHVEDCRNNYYPLEYCSYLLSKIASANEIEIDFHTSKQLRSCRRSPLFLYDESWTKTIKWQSNQFLSINQSFPLSRSMQ